MRAFHKALIGCGVTALVVLGVVGVMRAHTAAEPKVSDFLISYLGLVANLAMAVAAIWAVGAAVEWRDEMRGKSFHDLALDATAVAHRIEHAWHSLMDQWKLLANIETNPLGHLREDVQGLLKLDNAIPELRARMDGLCGKGYADPLLALSRLVNDLAHAVILHAEQRARPVAVQQFEPEATIMRARAGFHDIVAAKQWVTDLVGIVSDWAAPYLGDGAAKAVSVEGVAARVASVHGHHTASWKAALAATASPPATPTPTDSK